MADNRADGGGLNVWHLVTVTVALVGARYLTQTELKSARPSYQAPHFDDVPDDLNVRARLWQDPFQAVDHHRTAHSSEAPGTQEVPENHKPQLLVQTLQDGKSTVILPVLVDNSPYAESAEVRLRTRFAVLAALNVAGYVPESTDRIGYVDIQPSLPGLSQQKIHVPYERLEADSLAARSNRCGAASTRFDRVLVLWLDENFLSDEPLTRLAKILAPLRGSRHLGTVRVIGPSMSSTLQKMAGASMLHCPVEELMQLEGIKFYSSGASAPNAALGVAESPLPNGKQQATDHSEIHGSEWTLRVRQQRAGRWHFLDQLLRANSVAEIKLWRTCGTDDRLIDALLQELHARGVQLDGDHSRVAVISDWDTTYGRALPTLFADARARRAPRGEDPFVYVNYLRGLDGLLPGAKPSVREPTSEPTGMPGNPSLEALWNGKPAPVERSDGTSQLDYVRRMTAGLRKLDLESPRSGKGPIAAIGVLGSDVYDKLLLLNALHEVFPRVIFFTTDLDSRLLDPHETAWTRNLLVASTFGLTLNPKLQCDVPPFRDGYQAATFCSCLMAVNDDDARPGESQGNSPLPEHWMAEAPRLFEIGAGTAVDLSPQRNPDLQSVHPQYDRWPLPLSKYALQIGKYLLLGLLGLAAAVGTLLPASSPLRRMVGLRDGPPDDELQSRTAGHDVHNGRDRWSQILLGLFATGAIVLIAIAMYDNLHGGEPLIVFGGVSSWPTEFIRWCAICLALHLLINAFWRLRDNAQQITSRYGLESSGPTLPVPQRLTWAGWLLRKVIDVWPTCKNLSVEQVWRKYVELSSPGHVARRVGFQSLLYATLCGCFFLAFGHPFPPTRSTLSYFVDNAMLISAAACLTALTFYVADATNLCRKLCRYTAGNVAVWPPVTFRKFGSSFKTRPDFLSEWLDIELIATRTEALGAIVYYPFYVLLLLLFAQTSIFDRWHWPPSLVLMLVILFCFAVSSALILRDGVEKAREQALERLQMWQIKLKGSAADTAAGELAQLDQIIDSIKRNRRGSFASLTEQPIIRALLLPTGGLGALALLERFVVGGG